MSVFLSLTLKHGAKVVDKIILNTTLYVKQRHILNSA